MVKKVLIIDYYRRRKAKTGQESYVSSGGERYRKPRGVSEIEDAIAAAGYKAKIMHHTDAAARVKRGQDILKPYYRGYASGSDISWTEKIDEQDGRKHMHPGSNTLAEYLVNHKKPVDFDCGGTHAAAHALGYKVRNSGKVNRRQIDGLAFNNQYGIEEEDLDGRVSDVKTIKHAGKRYVSSFKYKNKKFNQYHPGRTEKGRNEIKASFTEPSAAYKKTA